MCLDFQMDIVKILWLNIRSGIMLWRVYQCVLYLTTVTAVKYQHTSGNPLLRWLIFQFKMYNTAAKFGWHYSNLCNLFINIFIAYTNPCYCIGSFQLSINIYMNFSSFMFYMFQPQNRIDVIIIVTIAFTVLYLLFIFLLLWFHDYQSLH